VGKAKDQNGQVHSKIEDLEKLGMSERENAYAEDTLEAAAEHGRAHIVQGVWGALLFGFAVADGERAANVGAKLNRNSDRLCNYQNEIRLYVFVC